MSSRVAIVTVLVLVFVLATSSSGLLTAADCRDHGRAVDFDLLRPAAAAPEPSSAPDIGGPARADLGEKWDVTGTFGPTETVRFTTTEGTWMNLDVDPGGEAIVFDLLGDLYLLPISGGTASRISDGPAWDMQPRFSPTGDRLLFTSDRGGGFSAWIATLEDGVLGEPVEVTGETALQVDGATWDPSGDWIWVRVRKTDISSIGVSEMWLFHVDGGAGIPVVEAKAIGEVDSFNPAPDGRFVYLATRPPFAYEGDPYGVLWQLQRWDRSHGRLEPVNVGFGGSAAPRLSPDGSRLAFLRRVDGRTTLWLEELTSGAERQLWDGLDRDQQEGFATHGVYPSYAWTPDGGRLVMWAGGGLVTVTPTASGASVAPIPFEAEVEQRVTEVLRPRHEVAPADVRARVVRWPVFSPDGAELVFQALGRLWRMSVPDGAPSRVTNLDQFELAPAFAPDGRQLVFATWSDTTGGALYRIDRRSGARSRLHAARVQLANPTFSPDGSRLAFVAGSGATLRGQDLGEELRFDLYVMPADGSAPPAFVVSTANRGANRRIPRPVFGPDGARLYWFEDLEGTGGGTRGAREPAKTGLVSAQLDGTDRRVHLRFRYAQEAIPSPDLRWVAFSELHNAYVVPMPAAGTTVDVVPGSSVAIAELSWDGGEWVGWADGGRSVVWSFADEVHRIPVAGLDFAAKPATRPEEEAATLAITVQGAGAYGLGGASYGLSALQEVLEGALAERPRPKLEVTIDPEAPWRAWQELERWLEERKASVTVVDDEDDSADDSDERESVGDTVEVALTVPRARPTGTVALVGARVITMRGDEVLEPGTIVVESDRIVAVGPADEVAIPPGAHVIEVSGRTIIPGLVDVHAHMGYGVLDISPETEWRYLANLAWGVTTTHDPSASTHLVFSQAEMVAAGVMVGPRIFSTGFILYGATNPDMAPVASLADARAHVHRLAKMGAISVKSYMQPERRQRQMILQAAREQDLLVVPEGGGDFEADMTMILDGHAGIEHALVVGPIYRDVVELFARTGVGYTPTLLVAYGGLAGENWFYQHADVWRNERLRRFHPPRMIDARARRRTMAPEEDYNHKTVAAGCDAIDDAGGLVNLGAHGQLQGLGAHWELWALTHGGMTPFEALRAATLNGARYLGLDDDIGSLESGKLADLVVLESNPLERIESSDSVALTMIGGTLYDAATMDRVWPDPAPRAPFPFEATP